MLFHSFQYSISVIRRVVKQHIEPRFRAFAGFFKVCNKFVQSLAFAPRFNKRDKQLYNYVCTVIKKIVFAQCTVAAGLHSEYRIREYRISEYRISEYRIREYRIFCRFFQGKQAFRFVYNVAIAALEPVVTAAEGVDEIRESG